MASKTFGTVIAEYRKKLRLSQKELAEKITKEDGEQISPQYLNDLEHDRRNPPADFLLKQLAQVLAIELDYLYTLAGEIPADLRKQAARLDEERAKAAWLAFRKAADQDGKPRS